MKEKNVLAASRKFKTIKKEKNDFCLSNSHTSYYMLKMCNAVSNRAESFWKLLRSIVGPLCSTVSDLVLLIKMM